MEAPGARGQGREERTLQCEHLALWPSAPTSVFSNDLSTFLPLRSFKVDAIFEGGNRGSAALCGCPRPGGVLGR